MVSAFVVAHEDRARDENRGRAHARERSTELDDDGRMRAVVGALCHEASR
jgi:hypothetical protein